MAAEPQIHQVLREPADDGEQDHDENAAGNHIDEESLELVAHPGAEGLRGEAVFVLADEVFVVLERKAKNGDNHGVQDRIGKRLQPAETRDVRGEVAHAGRPAKIQQHK